MTLDPETARTVAASARKGLHATGDARFCIPEDAKVGSPAMVYTPEGTPAFWMVPFIVEDSACGFARVELSYEVSQIGAFGSNPKDRSSWIDATFFERPPSKVLADIQAWYLGSVLSEPVLSYDASPTKWAWRIKVEDKIESVAFITPCGWYERSPGGEQTGREGERRHRK